MMRLSYMSKAMAVLAVMLATAIVVKAASFDFDPTPPTKFQLTEDVVFKYDVNITANESIMNFSTNAPYSNLTMNKQTGEITFTPDNNDVGPSAYFLIAIVRNKTATDPNDYITTSSMFNITNVNDAPNITSFSPAENRTIAENTTLTFNATVIDVDVNIGYDNLSYVWYFDGRNVSGNTSYVYVANFSAAGVHNITFIVNDLDNVSASIYWNITVNDTNRPPIFNLTIENLTFAEDSNLTNNITLLRHFYDLDDDNNLTFTVVGGVNLTFRINQTTSNVTIIPDTNWFGVESVYFLANDSINQTRSNNITINITNVNDAPVVQDMTNDTVFVGDLFTSQVTATDPDNNIQPWHSDSLTYSSNLSLINLSSSTGQIRFKPSAGDVNNYTVNITVSDGQTSSHILYYINVKFNTAPAINASNYSVVVMQNESYNISIGAIDIDNDQINFSINTTEFNITTVNSNGNDGLGKVNVPFNKDVGNYSVKVTVQDDKGASDSVEFWINITDVQFRPTITSYRNRTIKRNKQYLAYVNATDLDGDDLNISSNSTLFNITNLLPLSSGRGLINYTPSENDTGVYHFSISVCDDSAQCDNVIMELNITNNTKPVMQSISRQNAVEDTNFVLFIEAIDRDWQDLLEWDDNSSLFNVSWYNATHGVINFTPVNGQEGVYNITINVTDGENRSNGEFILNITEFNDLPYFIHNITNLSVYEDSMFYYDVNATDEETPGSLIYWTNSTLFTINNLTGVINWTPGKADVGNYTINFSVSDDANTVWVLSNLTVIEINHAPSIVNYTPLNLSPVTAENLSLLFNVSASDIENNTILYFWLVDGALKSNDQSWLYRPNFSSAGYRNVTIIVGDNLSNNSMSWNVTVNDTNRPPIFGRKSYTNMGDFSGINNRTNVSIEPGNITLAKNGSNYYSWGEYTQTIAFVADINKNVSIKNISWVEIRPANTSIEVYTRTSLNNLNWSNWSSSY